MSKIEKTIKIEGDSDFVRDPQTHAVINTNDTAYKNYIKAKNMRNRQRDEIDELKSEMKEIKSLLLSLIDNNK